MMEDEMMEDEVMEKDDLMMEEKPMGKVTTNKWMEEKPMGKIKSNTYGRLPDGRLQLRITAGQLVQMWSDKYFKDVKIDGYWRKGVLQSIARKEVPGGWIVTFDEKQERQFMENIKTYCEDFTYAQPMFSCNGKVANGKATPSVEKPTPNVKITKNKHERTTEGKLKLWVTTQQMVNMFKDGYWLNDVLIKQSKAQVLGGYVITLDREKQIQLMENIKKGCAGFKYAEQMFPCDEAVLDDKIDKLKKESLDMDKDLSLKEKLKRVMFMERCPEGKLKLTMITYQYEAMWEDGYFNNKVIVPKGEMNNLERVEGGYIITLNKTQEKQFMNNIKENCYRFKMTHTQTFFPCEKRKEENRIRENKYERCPAGSLKLTLTYWQYINLGRDGYWKAEKEGGYTGDRGTRSVTQKRFSLDPRYHNSTLKELGGYIVRLNSESVKLLVRNNKKLCSEEGYSEPMFPCEGDVFEREVADKGEESSTFGEKCSLISIGQKSI